MFDILVSKWCLFGVLLPLLATNYDLGYNMFNYIRVGNWESNKGIRE